MAKTSRRLTEAERAERRARDRDRLQHATEALLSIDGWQRWVKARTTFHSYSLVISGPSVRDAAGVGDQRCRHVGVRGRGGLSRSVERDSCCSVRGSSCRA